MTISRRSIMGLTAAAAASSLMPLPALPDAGCERAYGRVAFPDDSVDF